MSMVTASNIYKRAEIIADNIDLPITYCKPTFELYGYKHWMLDLEKAKKEIQLNGVTSFEVTDQIIEILEYKFETLYSRN